MSKNQDRRMDDLKRGKRCMDCVAAGIEIEWPTECLDFDHRDPEQKLGNIREFLSYPEKLETELAKCDVVCSNHHRIRTRKRGVSERTRSAILKAKATPESRIRTSEASKRNWANPLKREKNSKAVADAQRRPEVRGKMKTATMNSWNNPEIRRKRKEGMLKAWEKRREKQNKLLSSEKISE